MLSHMKYIKANMALFMSTVVSLQALLQVPYDEFSYEAQKSRFTAGLSSQRCGGLWMFVLFHTYYSCSEVMRFGPDYSFDPLKRHKMASTGKEGV